MEHEERFYLLMMAALDDELPLEERDELDAHLRLCADCAHEWRTLTAIEMLFRQTPLLMPAVDFAERTLARLPNRRARRMALGALYGLMSVSYTHLDVYKRQGQGDGRRAEDDVDQPQGQ